MKVHARLARTVSSPSPRVASATYTHDIRSTSIIKVDRITTRCRRLSRRFSRLSNRRGDGCPCVTVFFSAAQFRGTSDRASSKTTKTWQLSHEVDETTRTASGNRRRFPYDGDVALETQYAHVDGQKWPQVVKANLTSLVVFATSRNCRPVA